MTETTAQSRPRLHTPISRAAILEILKNRSFFALWLGQLLSETGDRFRFVAVLVIVNNLTGGDPLAITLLTFTIVIPQFVLGLLGGAVTDRVNRKIVLIVSDILRGVLMLPVLLVREPGQLWIVYLCSASLEIVSVFFYPARNAVIPNITRPGQLMTANAVRQGSYVIALIAGSALAGYSIELIGTGGAIIFDSATFFFSAGAIAFMSIPPLSAAPDERVTTSELWGDMKDGLRFIGRRQDLMTILGVTAVAMLGLGAIIVLGISYLETRLNVAAQGYGNTVAAVGLGVLIGGVVVSRVVGRVLANVLVGGSLIAVGVAMIAFAGAGNYVVVLISAAIIGICLVMARAALDTFTQALVPDEMLGRVQATVQMTMAVSTALAQGMAGLLAKLLNSVENVFVLAGVITLAAGVTAILTLRDAAREMARVARMGKSE